MGANTQKCFYYPVQWFRLLKWPLNSHVWQAKLFNHSTRLHKNVSLDFDLQHWLIFYANASFSALAVMLFSEPLVQWVDIFYTHPLVCERSEPGGLKKRLNSPWWFWLGLRAVYKSSQIYWLTGHSLRPPNMAPSHTTAFSEQYQLQRTRRNKRRAND